MAESGLSKIELKEVQAEIHIEIAKVQSSVDKGFTDMKMWISEQNKLFMPKLECGQKRGKLKIGIVVLGFGVVTALSVAGVKLGLGLLNSIGVM